MILTVLTMLLTYLATSIDEIPILFLFYTRAKRRGEQRQITLSYYIGTFLLIGIGLLGARGLLLLPQRWMVGFIGLIPFILGIKILLRGEEEEKTETLMKCFPSLGLQVFMVTLAFGADDLGVYIPLFTTFGALEIIIMLLLVILGTAVLCFVSHRLASVDLLTEFIEKRERYIIGSIFILLGIYVMFECSTIAHLMEFLQ